MLGAKIKVCSAVPSEDSRQEPVSLPLPSSRGYSHFLSMSTPLQSLALDITCPSSLIVTLLESFLKERTFVIASS
jgi:hypothetical protein